MKMLPTLGKFMFAIPMAIFGLFHFLNAREMSGTVPSFVPGGILWVYLTGAALVAAAVAVIIGKKAKLATQLLGLMLLLFAVLIHLVSVTNGNEMSMPNLLKDIALAGGAWYMSGQLSD
ncbi:DoxX family protein [Reichenbachiella carrageenanivorans]|uniref:DoxX family protein n=1 Tax=Reichenbachiella carrageenanivorans TaxID=2979869 RepID=A0ABY6CXE7_9BACT|nr:DoxX family protein [Reichenbachiella carrageenanivorans]UXX78591.1 DoxX family protein [Reichenbachiella carrageenanivorans]